MLSFFPRAVLDEIWHLIESVSVGFPTYFDQLAREYAAGISLSVLSFCEAVFCVLLISERSTTWKVDFCVFINVPDTDTNIYLRGFFYCQLLFCVLFFVYIWAVWIVASTPISGYIENLAFS